MAHDEANSDYSIQFYCYCTVIDRKCFVILNELGK